MNYATERTVDIEFNSAIYKVTIVMPTTRQKLSCTDDAGNFSRDRFFELAVKGIEGQDINGKVIKTGADVLDTPGTDDLFLRIFREINKWDLSGEERKNL